MASVNDVLERDAAEVTANPDSLGVVAATYTPFDADGPLDVVGSWALDVLDQAGDGRTSRQDVSRGRFVTMYVANVMENPQVNEQLVIAGTTYVIEQVGKTGAHCFLLTLVQRRDMYRHGPGYAGPALP